MTWVPLHEIAISDASPVRINSFAETLTVVVTSCSNAIIFSCASWNEAHHLLNSEIAAQFVVGVVDLRPE